jgi:uncharacterized protein YndB with AHSA1/START domain
MSNPVVIDATPGQSYADITREFDAPVSAVFAAHADPEQYARWVGPRDMTTEVTHWDFRSGGGYRFVQRDGDGEYAFRGVIHTVRDFDVIIQTFEYEGMPDEVSMDVLRFEELPGGRCRIIDHSIFGSVESLEGMMAQGMEQGIEEGYAKLDELLAERG